MSFDDNRETPVSHSLYTKVAEGRSPFRVELENISARNIGLLAYPYVRRFVCS